MGLFLLLFKMRALNWCLSWSLNSKHVLGACCDCHGILGDLATLHSFKLLFVDNELGESNQTVFVSSPARSAEMMRCKEDEPSCDNWSNQKADAPDNNCSQCQLERLCKTTTTCKQVNINFPVDAS
jgi:hypothetical protein